MKLLSGDKQPAVRGKDGGILRINFVFLLLFLQKFRQLFLFGCFSFEVFPEIFFNKIGDLSINSTKQRREQIGH